MLARTCLFLLLAAGLAGCGSDPSWVILFVYGDYQIPGEVDAINVIITDPSDDAEVADIAFELVDGDAFPLRLLLEPNAEHPKTLDAHVIASKDNALVAHLYLTFTWEEGREMIANQNEQLALQP